MPGWVSTRSLVLMLTSGRTVVDGVDGRDVAAHGLQDAAGHFVADIASRPSVRCFCGTQSWGRYSPMDYLPRLLETRCIARMTLTWLAIARTRVSGINASEAMSRTEEDLNHGFKEIIKCEQRFVR